MDAFFYAYVNDDGICYAINASSAPIENPSCIPVDDHRPELLGKRYVDGAWQDVEEAT